MNIDATASLRAEPRSRDAAVERPLSHPRSQRAMMVAIVCAIALGIVVRACYVFSVDFPLNDGGLFYVMIEELQRSEYRLPAFTAYNRAGIPYAYPPFGLYVAALIDDITPLTRFDVLRVMPFAVSSVILLGFFLLARALLGMGWTLVCAMAAFALIPVGFLWTMMGGGVTRAWGFLFVLLSLHQAYLLYTRRQSWRIVTTALFVGLTALSHIGTLPFLAFSLFLFFLAFGRHRHGLVSSLFVVMGGAGIAACWFLPVMAMHSPEPFLAAKSTGMSIFSADPGTRRYVLGILARFGVGSAMGGSTGEPLFPLIGVLALLGTLSSLTPSRLLLPIWWLLILLFDQRTGYTYAAVPIAMLAGIGITEVLYPVLAQRRPGRRPDISQGVAAHGPIRGTPGTHTPRRAVPFIVLGCLLAYAMVSTAITDPSLPSAVRFLVALTPEERAAMHWVSATTPPSSQFIVIPESEWSGWSTDKTSEWFPALSKRVSLTTAQGYEWMPGHAFFHRWMGYIDLRPCVHAGAGCLESWAKEQGVTFTHVYIPQPPYPLKDRWRLCCQSLVRSLKDNPRYHLIYDQPGAIMFARQD